MFKRYGWIAIYIGVFVSMPGTAYAMHIMEGFLPAKWCLIWAGTSIPFLAWGLYTIKKEISQNPKLKMLLGLAGAFVFVLSALKIPSVTGSCSHPTGVGLGAILFGPAVMTVLSCIVLLFQALLLAHGGLTTLGANTFSMGVVGSLVAFCTYQIVNKIFGQRKLAVFLAAAMGDLITYVMTSVQLALAFPDQSGGVTVALGKFLSVFAFTQIPLAISEGLLTIFVFNLLTVHDQQSQTQVVD